MKIMTRLLLTGLTSWSLGVGTAMAQDGGMGQSYWADQYLKSHQPVTSKPNPNPNPAAGTVHSFWFGSEPTGGGPDQIVGLFGGGG